MVQHAGDFREQRADPFATIGHLDPQQLLNRQRKRMFLRHRRHIIESIEIGQRLNIALVLNQLLGATMQQPDMRISPLHHFAVHLQNKTQHTVRGRMLRTKVDGMAVNLNRLGLLGSNLVHLSVSLTRESLFRHRAA